MHYPANRILVRARIPSATVINLLPAVVQGIRVQAAVIYPIKAGILGMDEERKSGWVTPELIVLVRNKPEEAVLAACKFSQTGPEADFSTCDVAFCIKPCLDISAS